MCRVFCDGDWIESKDQSKSGFRLIQTGNIGEGQFINKIDSRKFISTNTFMELNCTEVIAGDILISRLPEPAGRACIIPKLEDRMITAVDCTLVRFKNYCPNVFIGYTQTSTYLKQIDRMLSGSTRKRISRTELGEIMVPSFSNEEQVVIAERLTAANQEIELLTKELEAQKQVKKYLMQQLLTGKIRVTGGEL